MKCSTPPSKRSRSGSIPLFEDQALDIETDIKVMNTMLAREGLSGNKDFEITTERTQTT